MENPGKSFVIFFKLVKNAESEKVDAKCTRLFILSNFIAMK